MKNSLVCILALLITFATFSMHFGKRADSMINDKNNIISEKDLVYTVELHKTETTFCKRPFTTFLIESTASNFGITIGLAFILVNFFLLGLSGLLLFKLSEILGANKKYATINMVVYFLCFSNLYAFFPPVYTYDEPLQFCLIFLSLIFLYSEQKILFVITFTFSIIARESTVILIPALALFLLSKENNPLKFFSASYLKRLLLLILPFLAYVIFIIIYINVYDLQDATSDDLSVRFSGFEMNFDGPVASSETIISMFVILGIPLYFIYFILKNRVVSERQMKFINAFLLTVIINSIIVILFTKAREVRLFAIPLFFIWPIFSSLFKEEIKTVCSLNLYIQIFKRWKYLSFFLFFNFLNYMISFELYKTTVGGDDYFSEYLFVLLFILIAHVFISDSQMKRTISPS